MNAPKDFFDTFDFTKNLVICGPVWTGKTYQAQRLLSRYKWNPNFPEKTWTYKISDAKFKELVGDKQLWHKPHDSNSIDAYPLEFLLRCEVILFDDIGVTDTTDAYIRKLTYILDERAEKWKKHIFTTNLSEQELKTKLNERIVSRILANATVIVMTGPDRRRDNTTILSYKTQ